MRRPEDIRGVNSPNSSAYSATLRKLLLYSFLLFTIPIFLYFCLKHTILEGMFQVAEHSATLYGAFAAIAAVHVILGLFVYSAFMEEERARPVKTD
ncbi:vacuolar ATPase assembly integral membrane protein VMA21-like [Strongylocentrotus purpuratus]|uniref:Vacuolar ATPase assembly integral membrane protein VMA21 homolog n=1 Tax=Strongylocentrotus purpuratus TaxID=7668 RepID=A0A7M7HL11_STRPU|nr:vacuolar ATPase assembly integral membrane protein VMA21-like [Strongylocentrotus purpuratus]